VIREPRPSEFEYLSRDLEIYGELIVEHQSILAPLADFTDLNRQNYVAIVLDLYLRIRNLVSGIEVLLREELREPFLITQRGLFEALSTIAYITKHPNREEEALIFRAYSAIKHLEFFPDQPATVSDLQGLLARMPQGAVREARRRSRERSRSWSGLSIRKMADLANVMGYDSFYAFASSEAHVGIVGDRVQVKDAGDGTATLELGIGLSPKELESGANFARRALKHAFFMLWNTLDGPAVNLPVHDPDEWANDRRTSLSGSD
jgi:hypothetical protein